MIVMADVSYLKIVKYCNIVHACCHNNYVVYLYSAWSPMILEAALFQLTHNGKICISKTQNTLAGEVRCGNW